MRRCKLLLITMTLALVAPMVVGCAAPSPDIPPEEEGAIPPTPTPTLNRVVSERLIVEIDVSSWISGSLTISPDSRRVAYSAQVGNKWLVVVDGKEGKQYDGIMEDTPIFSRDSQRVAYAPRVGNKRLVVVDEEEGKPYDGIGKGSLIFSPDSQSVAYAAPQGNKAFMVVDGEEGKPYDGIMEGGLIFSPDSQRVAYAAGEGNKAFVVIDGEEGKPYDDIVTKGGRIIFDSPDSLHYLAGRGDSFYLVKERIE